MLLRAAAGDRSRHDPAFGQQGSNAAACDCRTRRQNSHGIAAPGDVAVAYAWHPWAGQVVRIHQVVERTSGSVTRCSLVSDGISRAQEIPLWMLDAVSCQTMRRSAHPVADLSALMALRGLLSDLATKDYRKPAIASPDQNRGDRHATPPPPNPQAEPSARLPRSGPAGGAQPKPGVELVTGTDTACTDRSGDAPACRTRRRRDAGSAELRR
jgi:hypothetical protein